MCSRNYTPKLKLKFKQNDSLGNNRYHLVELIGQGSQGQIFLARDSFLKRMVIIKILHIPDYEYNINTLIHESQMTAAIKHDSIIDIYDIEDSIGNNPPFMVSEYIPGNTLSTLIDFKHKWLGNENNIIWLGIELLRAIDAIHITINNTDAPYGYIHRDVKPDNIMIIQDNECSPKRPFRIKLIDMGIATPASPLHLSNNSPTSAQGTPLYMGPLALISSIDHRIDLWSVAVILFECLTYQPPFTYNKSYSCPNDRNLPLNNIKLPQFIQNIGLSTIDIFAQFNHLPVELLHNVENRSLVTIIKKALHPDWNKGYHSACQFLLALEKTIDKY
jgi:serine/threonine protein kinase